MWRLSLRVWWAICWPRSWGDYMPSNLLSADTGFPDLMGNQSTDEKFRMVSDYLYMLLEQLRYSMANLGRENFNDTAFQEIAGLITEPVYIQLKDVEGNLSSLTVTAEQLISRMTDAEGNISVLQQTSTSLTSQVSDLEGNVSTLQQSSKALEVRLTNAEGDLSRITVTVNGITQSVSDLETGLSQTLRIAPNGVTITNAAGDTLTIDGGQIDATNLNLSGHITFNDFSSRLQDDFDHVEQTAQDAYDIADKNRLPNYIKSTYIDSTEIRSPTIKANEFSVYPQAVGGGSFNMYGQYNGSLYHMLEISYFAGSAPSVDFSSPAGALATWDFLSTTVRGSVDFSNANVYGLDVDAVFA